MNFSAAMRKAKNKHFNLVRDGKIDLLLVDWRERATRVAPLFGTQSALYRKLLAREYQFTFLNGGRVNSVFNSRENLSARVSVPVNKTGAERPTGIKDTGK